jgi:hypothetical protein
MEPLHAAKAVEVFKRLARILSKGASGSFFYRSWIIIHLGLPTNKANAMQWSRGRSWK